MGLFIGLLGGEFMGDECIEFGLKGGTLPPPALILPPDGCLQPIKFYNLHSPTLYHRLN